jgi:uncharacterized protein (DUF1015 family)
VPDIRPFRALRFDATNVGDLAAVVAPSYTLIDAAEHERLLARHPANVVRVDLPEERHGDEPDVRYRRAARALAEWRSTAILHKDPHPSVYVYAQDAPTSDAPSSDTVGADARPILRGFFARLRLEALGPEAGIVPGATGSDQTAEDRYKVLRATGVNTSPIVGVYDDPIGATDERIAALTARQPEIDLVDEAGVRHRIWAVAADGGGDSAAAVVALVEPASVGPIAIEAGRSIYDTALRYRDERRMSRSCEEDPAFDYVLALLLERAAVTPDTTALTGLVINPHEW